MNWSLRSRLLLGIAATTVLGFAVAATVIFVVLRASLLREFDELLASKARALATLIKQQGDKLEVKFTEHPMQEFARKVRPEYFQVWDVDGTIIARSRRLGTDDLPRISGSLTAPGFQFTELPDGRRGRLVAVEFLPAVEGDSLETERDDDHTGRDADDADRVDFTNRRRVMLVVARETTAINNAISQLAWLLVGVSTAVVTATLGVVVWLLKLGLRPLDELAARIADVNEQELAYRFQLRDLPQELNPVVTRLNDLLSRLEEAFHRQQVLTADVAHELRTPLAGLRSTLEVTLSRARESKEYQQALRTSEAICDDMQRLVEALLSLARVEMGGVITKRAAVDVTDLVTKSWEAYRGRAGKRMLNASFDGADGIVLETDPTQFRVVLSNIFDNAVEYTPERGLIDVVWEVVQSGLRLTVSNTGCDLTEEQIPKVFDRFWRADSARAATGAHAGLGLPLCKKIVEVLGGSMDAASHAGNFVVTLEFRDEFVCSPATGETAAANHESFDTRRTAAADRRSRKLLRTSFRRF